MVKLGEDCFYCEECEMAFVDRVKACECEDNCKKNKTCDLEIMKHAINTNKRRANK